MSEKQNLTYRQAGVNIDAGNALVEAIKPLAKKTARTGANSALGGFGGLFDLAALDYKDPLLVAANDGVGTKVKLAIETGIHNTVGIDLVAMCVNDLIVQGAEPLFFLDYYACGQLEQDAAEAVIAGIAEGCQQAGAALIGGETAEMPGLYADKDYDLAGFSVGIVERGALLPRPDIEAGDVMIGLASSGPHSNGYSLIRKIVSQNELNWTNKAPFAPEQTLGQALLTPTRIYVKPVLHAQRETQAIKALAHITGGGFPENLPRVLPDHLSCKLDLGAFPLPQVFAWMSETAPLARDELLRTFNCGIGMIVIVGAQDSDKLCDLFKAQGEDAYIIGSITEKTDGPRVDYLGELGVKN